VTGHAIHQAYDEALNAAIGGSAPAPIMVGRTVICDYCNTDLTEDPRSAGITVEGFGGIYAAGPCCAAARETSLRAYGEERFIRERCPEGVSFADWVRGMRGPEAAITITPRLGGAS
jgi:hypothetical protein